MTTPPVVTMTESAYAILKALANVKQPALIKDLYNLPGFKGHEFGTVRASITALYRRDFVTQTQRDGAPPVWSISGAGRAVLKLSPKNLVLLPSNKNKNSPEAKTRKYTRRLQADSAPPPSPVLNISSTADKAADYISAVIQENHAYRDMLLKLGQQIATALGLQLVEPQPTDKD